MVVFSYAQNVSIEKKFTEQFFIKDIVLLDVSNRYGDVIVNTWQKDSIKVIVRVKADAKTQELVDREISRVDISVRKIGAMILAVTKVDPGRGKGVLSELVSQVEDLSKSVLGSNRLLINYEIWMPATLDLRLDNRYGDVYLDRLTSDVVLEINHGDFRSSVLEGKLQLKHVFGKASINHLEEGNLNLRGVDLRINSMGKAKIQSGSSEIWVGNVDQLAIDSRNDKYHIDEVLNIEGKGNFTEIVIERFKSAGRLEMNYGSIFLAEVFRDFNRLNISAKSTDVRLSLDQSSYIKTQIIGVEDKMVLPNSMMLITKEPTTDGRVQLNGFTGNTNTYFSQLDLDVVAGQLIVSIQSTDIFTNKK